MNKLTASKMGALPAGKYGDGGGLTFLKREDGGGQWIWRYTYAGARRSLGLGGWPTVSLADARKQAQRWRTVASSGQDPARIREIEERAEQRADTTLAAVTASCFEARKSSLKDDGLAGRWMSPLERHVLPKIGSMRVEDINQRDIYNALAPLWHSKADTARKAVNRIGLVLKHAAALGIDVDLQATMKAQILLGQTRHQPRHIPAMDWRDVPDFYASLADTTVDLALRLTILTGLRARPLRHIRLEWIDGSVLTIPAEMMKGLKGKTENFRVPLSDEALRVIEAARPFSRHGLLFWSRRAVVSDMSMCRRMERMGLEARPHGFRTSLRTWLAECTDAPHEVAEAMLAHVTHSRVVRTYRQTDFLEQRHVLAQRWSSHVTGGSGMVMELRHG